MLWKKKKCLIQFRRVRKTVSMIFLSNVVKKKYL